MNLTFSLPESPSLPMHYHTFGNSVPGQIRQAKTFYFAIKMENGKVTAAWHLVQAAKVDVSSLFSIIIIFRNKIGKANVLQSWKKEHSILVSQMVNHIDRQNKESNGRILNDLLSYCFSSCRL